MVSKNYVIFSVLTALPSLTLAGDIVEAPASPNDNGASSSFTVSDVNNRLDTDTTDVEAPPTEKQPNESETSTSDIPGDTVNKTTTVVKNADSATPITDAIDTTEQTEPEETLTSDTPSEGVSKTTTVVEKADDATPAADAFEKCESVGKTPTADNVNGASPTDVLIGKKFWGLRSDAWGTQTGTVTVGDNVNGADGQKTLTIANGLYSGSKTATANDSQLTAANIKSGVTIFGVSGDLNVVDTHLGDAVATDIKNGKKAWVDGSQVTGTMPTQTLSDTSTTINAGYYDTTTLESVDSDLTANNIKSGTTLFGVSGDSNIVDTRSGDAVAFDIKNGKKAWADGSEITGAMPTQILSDTNKTVKSGYYDATTLDAVDSDLTFGNIRSGVTLFGITGDSNVVNTQSGDAIATDIKEGKKTWMGGNEVTGAMPTKTLSDTSSTVEAGYYDATTLDGIESDLISSNIKSDITIFGMTGDSNVVDTRSGDAVAADIKSGKKAWADGIQITGAMPTQTLSDNSTTVKGGYYDAITLEAAEPDLTTHNIKSSITIFGIAGDSNVVDTRSGDVVATEMKSGKKAWVGGNQVTGTMPTQTLSDTSTTIEAGYYDTTTLESVDGDLTSDNIKGGVTLFGVTGDSNIVDSRSGDAIAADFKKGKKAWVDGGEITGTMRTQTLSDTSTTVSVGYYEATTLNTVDSDLTSNNIKSGTAIFGIAGDLNVVDTSSGDSVATDIKSGKKAWADGNEVIGTLPTKTLSDTSTTVDAGYYDATTLEAMDSDLVANNIKSNVTIFGVTGNLNVVDTSSGDAVATDIKEGKKVWVDGNELTGNLSVKILSDTSTLIDAGCYDAISLNTVDSDLISDNIKSGLTIFGVTGDANVVDTHSGDAVAANIKEGKKAWVNGHEITGALLMQSLSNTSAMLNPGCYDFTTLDAVDSDLTPSNIKSNVTIFGITGDSNVVDTSSADAVSANLDSGKKAWVDGVEITGTRIPASITKTGQTTSYKAGDDGDYGKGVTTKTRFTDNGNGTVTDNLTGLVWTKNANCLGDRLNWDDAVNYANALANGLCELSDGSSAGEWRLPNIRELNSLVDYSQFPTLPSDHPFSGIQKTSGTEIDYLYWSSTTSASSPGKAFVLVHFDYGDVTRAQKTIRYYVWSVRDKK
jgi:fructose-specific component phosphotransferase system IIB-like protein